MVLHTLFMTIWMLLTYTDYPITNDKKIEMYIPDGQLIEEPVKVYVSGIGNDLIDNLQFYFPMNKPSNLYSVVESKIDLIKPIIASVDYKYSTDNDKTFKTGILFLFNLKGMDIEWYLPGKRLFPIMRYDEDKFVFSENQVYIIHRNGAVVFTVIIISILIIIITLLVPKNEHYLYGLLSTADGRMSISLTQMYMWTIVIGASVLIFGCTRLEIPEIHESLWILMGLSVTTSVVSHSETDRLLGSKYHRKKEYPNWKQLITVRMPNGKEDADLTRAQLLFWTLITIIIFVLNSYKAGELWDVPPSMLILMGLSQTGFVTRKHFAIEQLLKRQSTDKKSVAADK